ncbi:MAG: hypothetical protein IPP48_06275 [Chitinophagaceae bacterium]|nr:hypothetical protein [Chitinophagaceae bacterium]
MQSRSLVLAGQTLLGIIFNFIIIFSISSGPGGRNTNSQPAKSPVRCVQFYETSFIPFSIFDFYFGAVFGQGEIYIKYPDSIKTSKIFFSPYAKYSYIPSIDGIVRVGGNYDSLLSYEHSDFDNLEGDDSLGTIVEKQRGLTIIIDTTQEIDLYEYFVKSDKDYGLYSSPKYITYVNSDKRKQNFDVTKTLQLHSKAIQFMY